jgi:hypothetical protein
VWILLLVERIILKYGRRAWEGFTWLRRRVWRMAFFEHGDKTSGSIKAANLFNNWMLASQVRINSMGLLQVFSKILAVCFNARFQLVQFTCIYL